MSILNKIAKFSDDENDGAAMVEFGFVAPIFITLLIGIFEVGSMLIIQNSLDAAAREAARFGVTGIGFKGMTRDKAIEKKVHEVLATYSGGIVDPKDVTISVKAYEELENIGTPEPYDDANLNGIWDAGELYTDTNGNGTWDEDQGVTNSFGIGGSAVMYVISYEWETILSLFAGKDIILQGTSPVVNERFR